MTDFMTDAQGYTTTYTETGHQSDGLLRIQWRNGSPQAQTPGHFFVEADRLEGLGLSAPTAPWVAFDAIFASGDSKSGYRCDAAKLQIIGVRQQDAIKNAENRIETYLTERTQKGNRPQGWTVVVELLCGIEGFDQPVVVKSNGIKTSMALVIDVYGGMRTLRKEASKLTGNSLPPWFFFAPVRCGRDDKNKVIYEKTQGAMVTPPRLVLPNDKTGRDLFNSLYVGKELVQWGEAVYTERKDWLLEPIGSTEAMPTTNGRNVPQPIDEMVDLPF